MNAPGKTLAANAANFGSNRFRFTRLKERLSQADAHPVSLAAPPSAPAVVDASISHFGNALTELSERNLTDVFVTYAEQAQPYAHSLALVLHNRTWLVRHTLEALTLAAREQHAAAEPIAMSLGALSRDLGPDHFKPFFGQVISTFTTILNNPEGSTIMWDPQTVLVPIFSALSAITKVLVRSLVANAKTTVAALAPLISCKHYRVREMTAESCIGYIMRKSRQEQILDALVKALIDAPQVPEGSVTKPAHEWPSVHGAGVALFEAMRAPAGALHIRAFRVLETSLDYVSKHPFRQNPNASSKWPGFEVLVHALARLCNHLRQKRDCVCEVIERLVSHGDLGLSAKNQTFLADVNFYLHNWFRANTLTITSYLSDAHIRRVVTLVTESIKLFPHNNRIVCEGFNCILTIIETCSSHQSHRAVLQLKSTLNSLKRNLPKAAVAHMCQSISQYFQKCTANHVNSEGMVPIVAILADTVFSDNADISSNINHQVQGALRVTGKSEIESIIDSETISKEAFEDFSIEENCLRVTLQVLRSCQGADFEAPAMNDQILAALATTTSILKGLDETHGDSAKERESKFVLPPVICHALEYAQLVRIPGAALELSKATHLKMSPRVLAPVLLAMLQYEESSILNSESSKGSPVTSTQCNLHSVMKNLLFSIPETSVSGPLLHSLCAYMRKFGCRILLRDCSAYKLDAIMEHISSMLSSSSAQIRIESARVLIHLATASNSFLNIGEDNDTARVDKSDIKKGWDDETLNASDVCADLRESFEAEIPNDVIFRSILSVLLAPHTLEQITVARDVIIHLTRLVRVPNRVSKICKLALCHFSVGIFYIRFRPLWDSSSGLWGALVSDSLSTAWIPMADALICSRDEILRKAAGERMPCSEETVEESDSEEEDTTHVADRKVESKPENDFQRSGSKTNSRRKRKRCDGFNDQPGNAQGGSLENGDRKVTVSIISERKKKRMKSRDMFVLTWLFNDWNLCFSHAPPVPEIGSSFIDQDVIGGVEERLQSVNSLTRHIELLNTVSKNIKCTLEYRAFIAKDLYLRLDPARVSRRTGDALTKQYAILVEKMGGLKISLNDTGLESRLRSRMLNDLCRPCPSSQTEILRCLCASRFPEIKPHRASLLRLISDDTFREEVAILTESIPQGEVLSMESKEKSAVFILSKPMVEVLVRICFSKMLGKQARVSARRAASLSFLASVLPPSVALPSLVRLALGSVTSLVEQILPLSSCESENFHPTLCASNAETIPGKVARGVLSSLTAIVEQVGAAVPLPSWRFVAVSSYALLCSSLKSKSSQDIRSASLRLIATMLEKKCSESAFICLPALRIMSQFKFDTEGAGFVTEAPALLKFVAHTFKSLERKTLIEVVRSHRWSCLWAFKILQAKTPSAQAVELAISVASSIIDLHKSFDVHSHRALSSSLHDGKPRDDNNLAEHSILETDDLISALLSSLRVRLEYVLDPECSFFERQANRKSVEVVMNVLREMSEVVQLENSILESLVCSLVAIVRGSRLNGKALVSSLLALESVTGRLFSKHNFQSGISESSASKLQKDVIFQLGSLLSTTSYSKYIDERRALCKVLRKLGDGSLSLISYIVDGMSATSSKRIGEADLDTRVEACTALIKILRRAVPEETENISFKDICVTDEDIESFKGDTEVDPVSDESKKPTVLTLNAIFCILHACVAAMQDEDSAVRGTAGFALQLLSRWIAVSKFQGSEEAISLLCDLLVNSAVSSGERAVRREYCRCLGVFVRSCLQQSSHSLSTPSNALLRSLFHLANFEDIELDFFENIAHLQLHRRSRAMRRLSKFLLERNADEDECQFSVVEGIREFIFPLSLRLSLDSVRADLTTAAKSSTKSKVSKESSMREVTNSAVELCQSSATWLHWEDYRREMSSIIRRICRESDSDCAEVLYSVLVGLANAFPGMKGDAKCASAGVDRHRTFLTNQVIPKMISFISSGAVEGEVNVTLSNSTDKRTRGHHGGLKTVVFRAPVAVAAVQLIAKLGEDDLNNRIPGVIAPLANALRSRMFDIRGAAKKALVNVVLLLDPKFFPYIIDQVLAALLEGFRKDSIVYVLQALLMAIKDFRNSKDGNSSHFPVDNAAKKISESLAEELEEGVHANSADFADPNATGSRLKAASHRAMRAMETANLLAELIDFDQSASVIMQPFSARLLGATSTTLSSRLESTLRKMIAGFINNRSLAGESALTLAFNLISSHLPSPTPPETEFHGQQGISCEKQINDLIKDRTFSNSPNSHILVELGWVLVSGLLSKSIVDPDGSTETHRKALSMLMPFVPEVLLSMRSRYDSLTLVALKAAQRLLRIPISGRSAVADLLAATIVEVLSRNVGVTINAGAPTGVAGSDPNEESLSNICMRSAAVLIQEFGQRETNGVKRERVAALLKIARNMLEQSSVEARSSALVFIRSTVSSKTALPEVYDAVEHVSKLAVKAQSASLRTACIAIAVQFLITFPLGNKRIRQHLEFFVRNLAYEHPHGRIAAIEAISSLIQKLPVKSLEAECDYFFVSLISVLTREDDQSCRKMASYALRTLFSSVEDGRQFGNLLNMSLSLIAAKGKTPPSNSPLEKTDGTLDSVILCSGGMALSSAAQSKKLSRDQINACIKGIVSALQDSRTSSSNWESPYSLLCAIEQLLIAQPTTSQIADKCDLHLQLKPLWDSLDVYMLHSHEWIRQVTSRILGRHLSAAGGRLAKTESPSSNIYSVLWTRNGELRGLLKTATLQLEANNLSDELAKQVLKNILCIGNMIWLNPSSGCISETKQADQIPGEVSEEDIERDDNDDSNRPFTWLIARVSGLSSRVGRENSSMMRRACGIRFLLTSLEWWGRDVLQSRLQYFVAPLVQILEFGTVSVKNAPSSRTSDSQRSVGKNKKTLVRHENVEDYGGNQAINVDALHLLALSLQEALIKISGADEYYAVYHALVARKRAMKDKRKRTAAIQNAVDPELAAKKRRKKSEARADRRQMKSRSFSHRPRVSKASFPVFEKRSNNLLEEE